MAAKQQVKKVNGQWYASYDDNGGSCAGRGLKTMSWRHCEMSNLIKAEPTRTRTGDTLLLNVSFDFSPSSGSLDAPEQIAAGSMSKTEPWASLWYNTYIIPTEFSREF